MRVAVVTESFLPHVNGVTGSVLRVLEHLDAAGHPALVVSPEAGGPARVGAAEVVSVPALPLPGYAELSVPAVSSRRLLRHLSRFAPDVVHLASPFAVGLPALRAASRLGVPAVAVFQTDVAGFATRYGLRLAAGAAWRRLERVHGLADRTLAPTAGTAAELVRRGVPDVHVWPRGVDSLLFRPERRDPRLRARLAPAGEVLVGYVGRLAAEKRLDDLAAVADLPGTRLVLVGDGPHRERLARRLPRAALLGTLRGEQLAAAVASLDVFVHPGEHETFCQAAQEALASGVPVVAPRAGALPELVADTRTGLLYDPGDLAGLRARVAALAADPARRAGLGAAARASVAGATWERVCSDLVEHYGAVLERRPSAVAA